MVPPGYGGVNEAVDFHENKRVFRVQQWPKSFRQRVLLEGAMARRPGRVTLTDVANLAGVSLATASKALNARAEVAPQTRAKVFRAAEELAFRPNALARSLVAGTTRTIGLLTDELAGRFALPLL